MPMTSEAKGATALKHCRDIRNAELRDIEGHWLNG